MGLCFSFKGLSFSKIITKKMRGRVNVILECIACFHILHFLQKKKRLLFEGMSGVEGRVQPVSGISFNKRFFKTRNEF